MSIEKILDEKTILDENLDGVLGGAQYRAIAGSNVGVANDNMRSAGCLAADEVARIPGVVIVTGSENEVNKQPVIADIQLR